MDLGKRIVEIRKNNNLSQEEFADIFNITRQTVSNWENYKSYPDIETLVKISDKFNISLDILLKTDKKLIKNLDNKIHSNNNYSSICIITIIMTILFDIFVGIITNDKKILFILIPITILFIILLGIIILKKIKTKNKFKNILLDIFTEEVDE